ncbi:LamG-like jellyroll fold domain-containing protein [Aurantibacillus circumpalustris]|uniref:LamG-like jellyroll fold domain-containing protein n=1 Tax=Aurantibacillus circumpalustris TaxID=3036359 RepID=UPI00295B7E68|nr:LamG-like jellyroll fold domain-containing protein [Aurantibacillus circumpalustris]
MKTILQKILKRFLGIAIFFSFHSITHAQVGQTLNFDGANDYVQVSSLSFGTNWTAETWIYPTNLFGNWNTVLGQCFYNNNQGFVMAVQSGSVFVDSPLMGGAISTSITGSVWTHIAVTYNNGIYAFYKNGLLVGAKTASFTNSTNPFYIGIRTNNNNVGLIDPYQGNIDEVRIWNVTRSQCDIQRFMTAEIPSTAAGLVANYHFNEGIANGINFIPIILNNNTLTDATGNGNNGTLNNYGLSLGGSNSNWTSPGCSAQGNTTPASASTATINVTGNGNTIIDGSTSPTTFNHTDFGTNPTRTFVIQSTGSQTLNVGTPIITGANANQFSVTVIPSSILAATTGSTSFVITFTPTSVGTKTATIHIYNSECTRTIYDFVISATASSNGLDLDGINDYVDFGSAPTTIFAGTLPYTIEAWVKRKSGGNGIIAGHHNFGVSASWNLAVNADGSLQSYRNLAPWTVISAPNLVPEDVWTHVAATFNGSALVLWVNGVSAGLTVFGSQPSTTAPLLLGAGLSGGTPSTFFGGEIDEFKIWNVARSSLEIANGMVAELVGNETNLVAYYHFNKGIPSGGNAIYNTVSSLPAGITGTLTNFALTGCNSNWVCGAPSVGGCPNQQEMTVTGNSVGIVSGASTATSTNFTDFGSVITGATLTRTFVIKNNGNLSLTISASNLTGSGASSYSITSLPTGAVAGGGTTFITVTFSPTTLGLKSATLSITNNDCDENPYSFAIEGIGVAAGAGLNFDGIDDRVVVSTGVSINNQPMTIEFWAKRNGTNSNDYILEQGTFATNNTYLHVGFRNTNQFTFAFYNGDLDYTGPETTDGLYHHWSCVYNPTAVGKNKFIYLDGILVAANTATSNYLGTGTYSIGGSSNTGYFIGNLDELRIWNVARTQCQIQSFKDCEIPTTATGLLANYHFNQGVASGSNSTVTILADATGSYNGTLTGPFALTSTTSNWVTPGGVTSGSITANPPLVSFVVSVSGTNIAHGATTPTLNVNDFGTNSTRNFTVQNTGTGNLYINTGYFTGAAASQFSVTVTPSGTLSTSATSSLTIVFTPTALGTQTAVLNIITNDCTNPTYSFVITASASPASALSFDGVDDVVNCGTDPSLDITVGTWEAWVSLSTLATNSRIFFKENTDVVGGGMYESYFWAASGKFTSDLKIGVSNYKVIGTTIAAINTWYHVAATYDGTYFKLYVNGVLDGITNISGGNMNPGTGRLCLGASVLTPTPIGSGLTGKLDEARLWNVVRTQCQIQQFMNCEITSTASGLVANYHFNQGIPSGANSTQTLLIDATGVNNGTLTNFGLTTGSISNWVSPSNIVNGYTIASAPTSSIALSGNSNNIPQGTSTSTNNLTDFGTTTTRTFVVQNSGTGTLSVNNISFTGANAAQFSITSSPASTLGASATSSFTILFTPTAVGSASAIVNIVSNDCTNPTYSFVITASASPASALAFDGSNDQVLINNTPALDNLITGPFSFEAWVNPSLSKNNTIISKGHGGYVVNGGEYIFQLNPSNQLAFFHSDVNGWKYSSGAVPLNAWSHVAVTFDGSYLKFYINGLLDATKTCTASLFTAGNNSVYIGRQGYNCNCNFFQGGLDEIRIWTVPRSECEIQQYMNCEIPTTATGLLANYHFNQGIPAGSNSTVTTLSDATGGNNGALLNFSLTNGNNASNWVNPGGVISGSITPAVLNTTLVVSGNGNNIAPGSSTSSTLNFTDFGTSTTRTFVLTNTGSGNLHIGYGLFTGANAANFSITTLPGTLIASGLNTSLVVTYSATSLGTNSAVLNIFSSDCTNPTYSFVITASATPASALAFDGVDDYVITPNLSSAITVTSDITIEAWINPNGAGVVIDERGSTSLATFWNASQIEILTNSVVAIRVWSSAPVASVTLGPINFGTWNHIVLRYNHMLGKLDGFLNGVSSSTFVNVIRESPITNGYNQHYGIGLGDSQNLGSGAYFNGKIDEVRIWNTVRTQCELQTYMNAEIPTTATGLVANYHFNQGGDGINNLAVTTLTDATGTNTGTLTNIALTGTVSNWIAPGPFASGYTVTSAPLSTITLSGNSNIIANNSTSTSTLNFTDFGSATSRTFVIQNTGAGTLTIAAPYLTGINASEFSVTVAPATTVAASASTSFVVVFTPTTGGFRTATLNINNNDCGIPIFNCAIGGTPSAAAALDFDGVSDYVSIAHTSSLNAFPLTVETWVKTSYTGSTATSLVGKYVTNSNNGWLIYLTNGNLIAHYFKDATNYINSINATTSITDNNWHHLALVIDVNGGRFYIDGILSSPNQPWAGTPSPPTTTQNVLIGSYDTYLPGSMDEVRIWNVARNQCEIQSYMHCEIPTSATGLMANYHFNQGAAGLSNPTQSVLIDAAGTNNGTLNTFNLAGATSNWIIPGGVISGYTTTAAPTASITLSGNSNPILNNSVVTSTLNFTNFGTTTTRTFVIQNSNTGTLNISLPNITGTNASDFSVTVLPTLSLAASATTSFIVVFTPTANGLKTATININNNDCNIPLFSFAIEGTPPPGSALSFDGVDDRVNTINMNPSTYSVLTFEAWVYREPSANAIQVIVGNEDGGYDRCLVSDNLGQIHVWAGRSIPTGLTSTLNTWEHFMVTWSAAEVKCIKNGTEVFITSGETANSSALNGAVGALEAAWRFPFKGRIDEARFWNGTRTQCEVQTYMNCEIPSSAPGLIVNYHFNQGAAALNNTLVTTSIDASGSSNTGTLNSFALTGTISNWVAPGGVVSGYTTAAPPTASIQISGNSSSILNGSTSTSTLNFTNFGTSTTRTFVIQNSNTGTLNISVPYITGTNASDFSITVLPTLSLSASATTSFVVVFTPTANGIKTATININNNDCSIPLFNFAIEGTPPPGAALNFDGVNDNIITSIDADTDVIPNTTWEAWIYPTTTLASYRMVVSIDDGFFDRYLTLFGNEIRISTSNPNQITITTYSANQWYHLAVVYTQATNKALVYVNGISYGPYSTNFAIGTTTNNIKIGANLSGANYFEGLIDEVRIWSTARTQCEIQTYKNCEIPTTAPGLIANYHFNQGSNALNNTGVINLNDATGSNTGTLTNFSLLTGTVSNWIAPGAVVSGYTLTSPSSSSVSITGNGNGIVAGSTTPNLTNFTDFGAANSRTFVIQSSGGGTMFINTPVTLNGGNASDFTVVSQPSSSITTGTTNLIINFLPTGLGTRTAIVNVNSSDCTSPNYSFVITASASAGAALHINGNIETIGTPVFNTQTLNNTLQAKVFWSGNASNQMVVYNGNSSNSGYGIYVGAAGTPSLLFGGVSYYNGNYTLTPNVWTSLSAVLKNGTGEFYVNGVLTNSFAIVTPNTPNTSFNIGCNSAGTEVFKGSIDEVLLWNRALTQCEIQAYLNCEIATSASSLVANYHFNQGIAGGLNPTVTVLTDASGNNHPLTLTNFSLSGLSSNWIGQGAVTSGSSCTAFVEPDINLISNAITIPDGNTVVATADNTDFGNITSTSVTVKSYTIQNTGSGPLTVSSITMSGADASQFIVGALAPASPIASGSFAVFSVTFAPTSIGTKTATVNIANNDCDESPYDFVLSGSANVAAAIAFDGTNDFINCGNILTASYTKEAWVKFSTSSNGNNFISAGNVTNGSALWAPGIYNYSLSAGHDGAWNQVQDNAVMIPGNWYHIAVSYDAPSTTMSLYKNGILVSSNTTVQPFTGNSPLQIGAFSSTYVATGLMDEVRIWNRPLCAAEILNNMNCEIPTTAPGLIANYHFNQGIGFGGNTTTTLVTDVSGSANTGTLVNFAGTGTISNWVPTSTVTTGSSCAPYFAPEINLVGNGITINDGASTATISNHTDFGAVCVNGQVVRTFTIQNTGNANLTVGTISVGGVNASLSNIGPLTPASPILPGNSAVFSVTFTPTSSGVKTTTLFITNNDCNESPYDFVMTGTCNPLPVVTASATSSVICSGFSTILNGGGADTYTWTGGIPTITNGVSFTPTTTLTYTVIGTNTLSGCASTNLAVQTITVNPNPTITATANNTVICDGSSITINPGGASTYTLNPGSIIGTSFTIAPSSNISYSVSGTSTNACVGINTVVISVTVNALPVVTATASSPVICNTATTSLIGGGADTYTWTAGATNNTAFTPSITTTYTVIGSNTLTGCTSTNSAIQTITVDVTPTITAVSVSSVLCEGESATITASGASSYTWNPGNVSVTIYNPTPSVTTSYTVVGTSSAGCTSTNLAVQSISVNSLPSVTPSISKSKICEGDSVILTGSGASTYTWTGGAIDGVFFTPLTTGDFTVSGTNVAGCTNTNSAVASVTVNALPSLTISSTKSVICIGDQTTLNASGAVTYTWTNGIINGSAFSPSVTTTYTLTGTDLNTCENMALTTITVNNLPVISFTSSAIESCEAQSVTLTVLGASSYTWNTTEMLSSIVVSPTTSTIYTVNAIDVNTCTNTASYTQSVISCPGTFTASTSKTDVTCNGKDDGSINVSSANSYTGSTLSYYWNPSILCPNNNCDSLKNLKAGTYNLTLKLTYTLNGTLVKVESIVLNPITILDLNGQCVVKVYNGVTANNDGVNDILTIENIEEFPNNTVNIFNRWGQQVYQVKGYDNVNKAWPSNGDENNLSSGTYFYVIDLGIGGKPIKGWVELIKN